MDKDIQKLTQNERLDLTDKQVISEREAYAKALMTNLQTPYKKIEKIIEFPLKQVIDNQERVIKEQKEEIERLQTQLNKEIHYNRKMKRVLEKYVLPENYEGGMGREYENMCNECKQTLKEIENKE